jgi:hypothetical protein
VHGAQAAAAAAVAAAQAQGIHIRQRMGYPGMPRPGFPNGGPGQYQGHPGQPHPGMQVPNAQQQVMIQIFKG